MTILFVILIIIAAVILGLIVLIQNPKGGGLAGNIAGFSTQFMGVKQTTDVLEKGTWVFATIIGVLCLFSTFFMDLNAVPVSGAEKSRTDPTSAPIPQRPGTAPVQGAPTTVPFTQPQDSNGK